MAMFVCKIGMIAMLWTRPEWHQLMSFIALPERLLGVDSIGFVEMDVYTYMYTMNCLHAYTISMRVCVCENYYSSVSLY